ncbi:hypothetical protein B0J11DRAFT_537643 [Dendryphion nanum]|uniref:Cell death in tomato 1 n=1 Tax=Dendryphion nanum TaxID=256645 RepID=A0A9P9IEF3_9PLEO|nr:hypothetical protein B0J11DRAFT_537643 [Dendryphion nanum]
MHFSRIIATTILAYTASTTAAPLEERQTSQSWQITSFSAFTPSLRPGQYPWATIQVTIEDPNTINVGTDAQGNPVNIGPSTGANCRALYYAPDQGSVLGPKWPCDNDGKGEGWWYFEVVPPTTGSLGARAFNLKFTHVAEKIALGNAFKKTFQGTANLDTGVNVQQVCGGSGVCSWGLKAENNPFAVQQTEI